MLKKLFVVMISIIIIGGLLTTTASAITATLNSSVRIVHLSPNANELSVDLQPVAVDLDPLVEWKALNYTDYTDFTDVTTLESTLILDVDGILVEKHAPLQADLHYTFVLTGLVVPDKLEQISAEGFEDHFLTWLWEFLFGTDRTRELIFQPWILKDTIPEAAEDEVQIRLVHAAPGTEAIDLAFSGHEQPLINNISYRQDSSYVGTELLDDLEIRIADSLIPLKERQRISDLDIEEGGTYTIFLTGTPSRLDIEKTGLRIVILEDN